jgi:hypothetical protein
MPVGIAAYFFGEIHGSIRRGDQVMGPSPALWVGGNPDGQRSLHRVATEIEGLGQRA